MSNKNVTKGFRGNSDAGMFKDNIKNKQPSQAAEKSTKNCRSKNDFVAIMDMTPEVTHAYVKFCCEAVQRKPHFVNILDVEEFATGNETRIIKSQLYNVKFGKKYELAYVASFASK